MTQAAPSTSMERETSFSGQMGAIYFFEDALSQSQVEGIFSLGPNYLGTFQLERYAS